MTLRDVLQRAARHFSDPDARERYFELYAPHVVLHRAPPLAPGLEAVQAFYRAYWAAFPDIRLALGACVENGPMLACAFTVSGTHRGPFLGLPATGRSMSACGVTLLRFEDGRCVERWSQTDLLGVARQLGADLQPIADDGLRA